MRFGAVRRCSGGILRSPLVDQASMARTPPDARWRETTEPTTFTLSLTLWPPPSTKKMINLRPMVRWYDAITHVIVAVSPRKHGHLNNSSEGDQRDHSHREKSWARARRGANGVRCEGVSKEGTLPVRSNFITVSLYIPGSPLNSPIFSHHVKRTEKNRDVESCQNPMHPTYPRQEKQH